jgi:hypothetical protein
MPLSLKFNFWNQTWHQSRTISKCLPRPSRQRQLPIWLHGHVSMGILMQLMTSTPKILSFTPVSVWPSDRFVTDGHIKPIKYPIKFDGILLGFRLRKPKENWALTCSVAAKSRRVEASWKTRINSKCRVDSSYNSYDSSSSLISVLFSCPMKWQGYPNLVSPPQAWIIVDYSRL